MKVVILCGGFGTRFREETESRPKPMVEIGGRPILWPIMKTYAHYGYQDFVLCLGYKGEAIRDYFINYKERDCNFTLDTGHVKKEIVRHGRVKPHWNIILADTGPPEHETGSRVALIKNHIGDDKEFFLTYGDGVSDIRIDELLRHHRKIGKIMTLTGVRPNNPFGVIEIEGHEVKRFMEKPELKDWVNGGFFVCSREVFDFLWADGTCAVEKEPVQRLAEKGRLGVYRHNGFWRCVDTQKDFLHLNSLFDTGEKPWMVWES